MQKLVTAIEQLKGPIVVIGAGGFIGANLLKSVLQVRKDVYGIIRHHWPGHYWRLMDVPAKHLLSLNLFSVTAQDYLYGSLRPATIFYLPATGNYYEQQNYQEIYRQNVFLLEETFRSIARWQTSISAFIHAGSSSEYGHFLGEGLREDDQALPISDYGRSKFLAGMILADRAKTHQLPIANLRFFSVYGPLEDSQRLIPQLIINGEQKIFPPLAGVDLAHDFVYIDDVISALVLAGGQICPQIDLWGQVFNVATGKGTRLRELVHLSQQLFQIEQVPIFNHYPAHTEDRDFWSGNPEKIKKAFGWQAVVDLSCGLQKTWIWYQQLDVQGKVNYRQRSKRNHRKIISIVVACYHDEQAMPIIAQQVAKLSGESNWDYQLIFVIDGCPYGSKEAALELSANDFQVVGIVHGRSYGSMAAFRSGMANASGDAVVLMDGDLQDPVALIGPFVERWQEGNQVVVGVRTTRTESYVLQCSRKLFYRIFNLLSQEKIIPDTGEFSLIDRQVVTFMLAHGEQGAFWRALRSLAPVKTAMVNYHRPARTFGKSTNSFWRNLRWVKFALVNFYPNFCPILLIGMFASWLIAWCFGWQWMMFMIGVIGIVVIWFLQALLLEQKKRPTAFCQSVLVNGKEIQNVGVS